MVIVPRLALSARRAAGGTAGAAATRGYLGRPLASLPCTGSHLFGLRRELQMCFQSALAGAWARLPPRRRLSRPYISGLCVPLVPGPEPVPAQRDGRRPTASLCFAGRGRSRSATGHNAFGSRSRLKFSVAPDSRHHSLTYNALVGTYLISFAFGTHFTAFGAWVRTVECLTGNPGRGQSHQPMGVGHEVSDDALAPSIRPK